MMGLKGERQPSIKTLRDQVKDQIGVKYDNQESDSPVKRWTDYVKVYSRRKLSVPTDKLLACAALAEDFATDHGLTGYFAGLWKESFCSQLLWTTTGGLRPSHQYFAPSWSWASFNRPIHFYHVVEFGFSGPPACEVLELKISLINPQNRFGQVQGGFLRLRARTKEVHFINDSRYGNSVIDLATMETVEMDMSGQLHVEIEGVDAKDELPIGAIVRPKCLELFRLDPENFFDAGGLYTGVGLALVAVGDGTFRRFGRMTTMARANKIPHWFDESSTWEDIVIV